MMLFIFPDTFALTLYSCLSGCIYEDMFYCDLDAFYACTIKDNITETTVTGLSIIWQELTSILHGNLSHTQKCSKMTRNKTDAWWYVWQSELSVSPFWILKSMKHWFLLKSYMMCYWNDPVTCNDSIPFAWWTLNMINAHAGFSVGFPCTILYTSHYILQCMWGYSFIVPKGIYFQCNFPCI